MISYIDIPQKREASDYSDCVNHLVKKIGADPNVVSIYRFGSVTTPGISDIDMLVVYRDGQATDLDPFESFPQRLNGLFTHGVDIVCESHFMKLRYFSFLENMSLIFGKPSEAPQLPSKSAVEESHLQTQIAMEFLITNYVDFILQLDYGIVKLRAFLQHTKGLLYDLQLLKITTGDLHIMILELRDQIKMWWSMDFSPSEFSEWLMKFYKTYEKFINTTFREHHFYFPPMKNYYYLKNVEIRNGTPISWKRSGITLPNYFSFLGKKYFNLQRRLNKYTFLFPFNTEQIPPILVNRYAFFEEMKRYNKDHFPFFDSLTTGFKLKEK